MSPTDQKQYWKDPYAYLTNVLPLNRADVCVDGSFIATIATVTLTKAVLIPKPLTAQLGQNAPATLIVQGTNLTTSDTRVTGLGTTVPLTTSNGTTGTVDITLPPNYVPGMTVQLASAANPSSTSSAVATTTMQLPTLTAATLAAQNGTPGPNLPATLNITGTNLIKGDTQVIGLGSTALPLTTVSADGTSGSVAVTLPGGYDSNAGASVYLTSALVTPFVPTFQSRTVVAK
jgi:hypothetical protein